MGRYSDRNSTHQAWGESRVGILIKDCHRGTQSITVSNSDLLLDSYAHAGPVASAFVPPKHETEPSQQTTGAKIDGAASWSPAVFDRKVWKNFSSTRRRDKSDAADGVGRSHHSDVVALSANASNHFGNLPFSDAIWANHYPLEMQRSQAQNILLPVWAMRVLNTTCDWFADPFDGVFIELSTDIANGADAEILCGPHAFIAALDDKKAFHRAPKLSQVVASMVNSIKPDEPEPSITRYAMMWIHWSLWRWMLSPSPVR